MNSPHLQLLKTFKTLKLYALALLAVGSCMFPTTNQAQVWGEESAPVVLVVFSSFTCPFSAQAKTLIDELKNQYPKDLQVIFKHFPLNDSEQAREPHLRAAAATEQGKFWELHDANFGLMNGESNAANARSGESLKLMAQGVDLKQIQAIIDSGKAAAKLRQDMAEAQALKVRATPTFFIDGVKLEGMQDKATLERLIGFKARKPTASSN
jgi:protein-disulfide isomerase